MDIDDVLTIDAENTDIEYTIVGVGKEKQYICNQCNVSVSCVIIIILFLNNIIIIMFNFNENCLMSIFFYRFIRLINRLFYNYRYYNFNMNKDLIQFKNSYILTIV